MNDFITEVKEDLKRERFEKIFREYGKYIVFISLTIVLSVAAGTWYKHNKISKQEADGESYRQALSKYGDKQLALLDPIIDSGTVGYRNLARFKKASMLFLKNEFEKSVELLDAITSDSQAPEYVRDLAAIRAASILMNQNYGTESLQSRIDTLLQNPNGAWYFLAKELSALYKIKNQDIEGASLLLNQIKSSHHAGPALRERAEKILTVLQQGDYKSHASSALDTPKTGS